jgi:nicastrin
LTALFCDPLGGTNIFNTLMETSKNDSIENNSVIVLASRLDSFSMFDQISPGADSAISSLVTLLTVAHTLNKPWIKDNIKDKNKNVLFALFDGEAFDYIGSGRTVYDMTVGKFPVDPESDVNRSQIRIEHFSHFIELNQLGFHANDSQQKLWIHKNINSTTSLTKLEEIIKKNAKKTENLDIESVADGAPLPPSSLQSFLKENNKLVGVVIANHEKEFKNKFYNSLFDDINNLNISDSRVTKQLTSIATVISKSIHELLTGNSNDSITANETLVHNLLDCYLNDSSCDLFKYVVTPDYKFSNGNYFCLIINLFSVKC